MLPRLLLLLALFIGLTHSGLHDVALLLGDADSAAEAYSLLPEAEPTDDGSALTAGSLSISLPIRLITTASRDNAAHLRGTSTHTYQAQAPPQG